MHACISYVDTYLCKFWRKFWHKERPYMTSTHKCENKIPNFYEQYTIVFSVKTYTRKIDIVHVPKLILVFSVETAPNLGIYGQ
jgi:hypothetical protein